MLSQFYPPTIGGEERHVYGLSTELARRGHDIAVATFQQRHGTAQAKEDGVRVYSIPSTTQRVQWLFSEPARPHAPPFPDPEATLALRRVIAEVQPDIIHAHNWLVHSFLPLKQWSRARLVVSLHDYSLACAKKRLMRNDLPCSGPGAVKCLTCAAQHYGLAKGVVTAAANWAMSQAERAMVDMFLPVSHATARGNGLCHADVPYQVVPNFIPDEQLLTPPIDDPQLAELPKDGFLLFVGDVSRDKGIHILLQAYERLAESPPLVLVGRLGPDAPQRFPDGVRVLHGLPHALVMEVWRRSSIAIIPSVWPEPFGIVVLEAMARGKPIIASQIGGIPDIIADGETGILVPPADPTALQHALEHLLSDAVLCDRLGAAAQQRVLDFRASVVVSSIEHIYERVLQ